LSRTDLLSLAWPGERLGEAVEVLARRSGLDTLRPRMQNPGPDALAGGDQLGTWLEEAASWLGCVAEPIRPTADQLRRLLLSGSPLLVRVPGPRARFLTARGGRRGVVLVAPDFAERVVDWAAVATVAASATEERLSANLEQLLAEVGVPPGRRPTVRAHLVSERAGGFPVAEVWALRPLPGGGFGRQARRVGLWRRLAGAAALEGAHYALWLASWWLVGQGALTGRLDRGWMVAWLLLLFTLVPVRLLAGFWQGWIAVVGGGLLRRRLLHGALRFEADELRVKGAGQLFGTVVESEAVETLALSGGFLGLVACIELALAAVVLALGAGGVLHGLSLIGWTALAVAVGLRHLRRRRRWTDLRVELTHRLIERMIGHRTVLAQEGPSCWLESHDRELESYLNESSKLDRSATFSLGLFARGWLVVGLLGVAPAFVSGGSSLGAFAISLGGVLLAARSLRKLALSQSQLSGAAIAWKEVAPLFRAAARPERVGAPRPGDPVRRAGEGADTLLQATQLTFRYPDREETVLSGCNLSVQTGDRVLLLGPSGAGKSTLAALLGGLRDPQAGLVLFRGLDLPTLGDRSWRRQIAGAPQFHENHVVSDTLAFNLLMGRGWPPTSEDLADAAAVCRGLGLGPLLERMPAGMQQIVGETGWQLSHGERSRIFMARALLQGSRVLVLDESFAALDPESLAAAVAYARQRAESLIAIAHP
jgi:ABC-type multidrug transport system fused ATPase/permease subunit